MDTRAALKLTGARKFNTVKATNVPNMQVGSLNPRLSTESQFPIVEAEHHVQLRFRQI